MLLDRLSWRRKEHAEFECSPEFTVGEMISTMIVCASVLVPVCLCACVFVHACVRVYVCAVCVCVYVCICVRGSLVGVN